jgi:hypothetical protein
MSVEQVARSLVFRDSAALGAIHSLVGTTTSRHRNLLPQTLQKSDESDLDRRGSWCPFGSAA